MLGDGEMTILLKYLSESFTVPQEFLLGRVFCSSTHILDLSNASVSEAIEGVGSANQLPPSNA